MSKHRRYPIRVPRYATGIRAQETRAGGGRSWWAREWQRRLEAMGLKGRLGRGKNYAISGQVVAMAVESGEDGSRNSVVTAVVVGTRPDPYSVSLDFRAPSPAAHDRLVAALRAEPMLVARLLADDLPMEVAEIFRRENFDLFPGGKLAEPEDDGSGRPRRYDMVCACSCPDYANPCKHSAAVLLLLGEEIARVPATLLALRGIPMEELYDEN